MILRFLKPKIGTAVLRLGGAAAILLLLAGCQTACDWSLTNRLWNEEFRKFNDPAPNPNLALFEPTNQADLLVQYDAFSERHSIITRQAYFLQSNQARIEAGQKPVFVDLSAAEGAKPIPVFSAPLTLTNFPPEATSYAVLTREGRGFTLYGPPRRADTFDLPVYCESSGTTTRIVLTPLAVAGDAAMVAGVIAVVGFLLWAQSGAPTTFR